MLRDLSKKKKIKTMNIKMAINQQLNLKNKLSKQLEQKQNYRYGDHEGLSWSFGMDKGENGGKGTGIKKQKLVSTK